ncbi:MAG: GntR family transcriptional regulator [Thermoleophilia bacterium]
MPRTRRDDANAADAPALGRAADAVRRRVLEEIARGALQPGQRLGAERELAEAYGVSRSTLRAALDALESTGSIRRQLGRSGGIFVAERKVERDLTSLAGLPSYLRRQGFTAGARVLATATLEADEETAAALGLPAGALVYEISRVRLADGDPISLERATFPADRFPDLLDRPLGGSLYELLEDAYGLQPGEAEERIEVVGATSNEARVLGVQRGAPLVSVGRIATDREGRRFERSHDLFRGDRVRIVVRSRAAGDGPVASVVEVV